MPLKPVKIPPDVEERMKRGRTRMRDTAPARNEALRFWRGDQYVYRGENGMLINQQTITLSNNSGKPRHRVRTTRNLLVDIVAHEVSAATQRVPGYEVNPSTSDPEDINAARLGEKVARYGYDKWNIRSVTEKVATYAIVADEGFAWPFWDSSVGPYFADEEGNVIGEGEINIRVFGGNEVFWENGLKFEESPWHAVEQARTLDSVYQMEGYIGGKLKPDGQDESETNKVDSNAQLVLVTEYLERPCPKYPNGRWLTFANGKVVVPERPYPNVDGKGNVIDEPVLHKLSYIIDPDSDRDMGLVRHLIDAQRTINDCTNKTLEWKNLALNPQVIIQNGEFKQRLTDEPGQVYHATGTGQIVWREVPPIPKELLDLKQDAINDMARISAQNDIPSQVESGKGIEALLNKDLGRRTAFIGNLAQFHSRLMQHCLHLVQRHYTEGRTLQIQGVRGPKLIHDFMGSQLRGQADVVVLPGSIEPRTKQQVTELVMAYAQQGWISPDDAMLAIQNGTVDQLVERLEMDRARANEIIQSINDNTFYEQVPRPVFPGEDPGEAIDENGIPIPGQMAITVPGWMPRPFDNIPIHKDEFEGWMKSQEWGLLTDDQKNAGMFYYGALLRIEQEQAAKAAAQEQMMAVELGMGNAAKPPSAEMPDQKNPASA